MNIDLSMIAKSINKETECAADIAMTSFRSRLGDFPITGREPVVFHIRNQENETVHISAEVNIEAEILCSRCLEPVPTPVRFSIDRVFRIGSDGLSEEDEEAADYLSGYELDTEKLLYAEILVNWPVKVLCRDDCRGICKVCGTNLNEGDCSCQKTEPHPGMAAIADIFQKFKEV